MPDFITRHWKHILTIIIAVDILAVVAGGYLFIATDTFAGPPPVTIVPMPAPTITPTPWAGPPKSRMPTPTLGLPTPLPTKILAQSGFPVGFTPTPLPTREPMYIKLPDLLFGFGGRVDAPNINQVLYPEPFFAPGTNNACGPVALFAGLLGMGINIDYSRVRDVAVSYGFNAEGISKAGMVNTITVLNQELGYPYTVEQGNHYRTRDLTRHLSQGNIVVVLLRVKRINGRYQVTTDWEGSVGHFLLVERINLRTRTVYFAGSTLGMEKVSLGEFVASWTSNPQAVSPPGGWQNYLRTEPPHYWALILNPS